MSSVSPFFPCFKYNPFKRLFMFRFVFWITAATLFMYYFVVRPLRALCLWGAAIGIGEVFFSPFRVVSIG